LSGIRKAVRSPRPTPGKPRSLLPGFPLPGECPDAVRLLRVRDCDPRLLPGRGFLCADPPSPLFSRPAGRPATIGGCFAGHARAKMLASCPTPGRGRFSCPRPGTLSPPVASRARPSPSRLQFVPRPGLRLSGSRQSGEAPRARFSLSPPRRRCRYTAVDLLGFALHRLGTPPSPGLGDGRCRSPRAASGFVAVQSGRGFSMRRPVGRELHLHIRNEGPRLGNCPRLGAVSSCARRRSVTYTFSIAFQPCPGNGTAWTRLFFCAHHHSVTYTRVASETWSRVRVGSHAWARLFLCADVAAATAAPMRPTSISGGCHSPRVTYGFRNTRPRREVNR